MWEFYLYFFMLDLEALKNQINILCIERGVEPEEVKKAIETGLAGAYRKETGDMTKAYKAEFDLYTGKYAVWEVITVAELDPETGELRFEGREITLMEARLKHPNAQIGDQYKTLVADNENVAFGRIASQIGRQVLTQDIGAIRHSKTIQKFATQIGTLINVEVDYYKKGGYIVKLADTTTFIDKENIVFSDRFKAGQFIKVFVLDIRADERGNSKIILSRTCPEFVGAIIAEEVPEVESGMITIENIAREAGKRKTRESQGAKSQRSPGRPRQTSGRKTSRRQAGCRKTGSGQEAPSRASQATGICRRRQKAGRCASAGPQTHGSAGRFRQ